MVSIHAPVWVRLIYVLEYAGDNKVSIHAPVWVRHAFRFFIEARALFQFTHPCGCDLALYAKGDMLPGFNSRTRVGATLALYAKGDMLPVSIHAPVWVRQALTDSWATDSWFQFTHPCGCDGLTNTV